MTKKGSNKYFSVFSLVLIVLASLATVAALKVVRDRYTTFVPITPPQPKITPTPSAFPTPPRDPALPTAKLLNVPFTPQAPTANWDELHGEACEEASSIMAHAYFDFDNSSGYDKNQDNVIDPEFVEREITKLTDWEKETFGYNLDINAEETKQMLEEVYHLNAELRTNFTEEDIKKEIVKGNLVLFPAQGQQLGNPNFRRPGPPYHMIVIKGYNSQGLVTNDPGTRNGANYTYTYDVLHAANGDWDHEKHGVDTSKKVMIVVSSQ